MFSIVYGAIFGAGFATAVMLSLCFCLMVLSISLLFYFCLGYLFDTPTFYKYLGRYLDWVLYAVSGFLAFIFTSMFFWLIIYFFK